MATPALANLKDVPIDDLWRLYPHTYAEHASEGRWKAFPYLAYISRRIATAIVNGNGRIIIEAPPRHGKSLLVSFWLPIWLFDLTPTDNIILAAYGDSLAESWGRKVRNEMEANNHISVKLSPDSTSAKRFHTTFGGGMTCAGVGSGIVGKGFNVGLIDDPVKDMVEALSSTTRERNIEWFKSTFYTRAEPGATMIVMHQRWHENDLAGWLQTDHEDHWEVISLPAIAEDNDVMGRKPGEALCPERYDVEGLDRIRKGVGSRIWASHYQQRPSPAEGTTWKRQFWRYWVALPERLDEMIISADLTFKGLQTSDYVAMQVWGRKGADKYLVDQVHGQFGVTRTIELFAGLCRKYPTAFRKLIENKANGPAVEDLLKSRISGIILVEPKGGKMARAMACEPQLESGNVYLPADRHAHPWVEAFIEECATFPNGKHDDMLDAASQSLIYLERSATRGLEALVQM